MKPMDPTTSIERPTGMRTAMSSSIRPNPMAATARPLMARPRTSLTAVATATHVRRNSSAVEMAIAGHTMIWSSIVVWPLR